MHPTLGHGKICYVMIPARDIPAAAAFYETVLGWTIRRDGHGHIAFDDGVGEVSGMWVESDTPIDAWFLHIMTDDIERTCAAVVRAGGAIVQAADPQAAEITAEFRDPAGNRFSLYQDPSLRSGS